MTPKLLALTMLIGSVAGAAEKSCRDPLMLVYMNGVLNTRIDAEDSLLALTARLKGESFQSAGLTWKPSQIQLGYNPTHGLMDLVEAYEQKRGENASDFWNWISDLTHAPEWFRQLAQVAVAFEHPTPERERLSLMGSRAASLVLDGYRVLVVAHSQGNFFANDLISSVESLWYEDEQASLRMVSVATPASKARRGEHTTLSSDGFIRAIPHALPANASNSFPSPGLFDHEFVKHYLNGNGAGPQIESQIYRQASILGEVGSAESRTCQKWFKKLPIQGLDFRACQTTCLSAVTDLGTFDCGNRCSQMCHCASPSRGPG